MKFKDLLDRLDYFDAELIVNGYESQFGFVWDNTLTRLTEKGEKQFSKIINSDFRIDRGNILIDNEEIDDDDVEMFLASCAGHISKTRYDEWFKDVAEVKKC